MGVISPTPSVDSSSIQSGLTERVASPKGSIVTAASPEGSVDTVDSVALTSPESPPIGENIHTSPASEDELKGDVLAPGSLVFPLFPPKTTRPYRPGTPPPLSYGPDKVTFISTATGLVPTNLDPNPTSPAILASTTPIQSTVSISSQPVRPTLTHQTSKDNFASIIRNHLPSPNPDAFKLTDLSATIERTSARRPSPPPGKPITEPSKRNIQVLRNVFGRDNLKQAQHQEISEDSVRSHKSGDYLTDISSEKFHGKSKAKVNANPENEATSLGTRTIEQAVLIQEHDRESYEINGGEDRTDRGKGKEKATGMEQKKSGEDQQGRSRSRSRSKRGERRKLNLWEIV